MKPKITKFIFFVMLVPTHVLAQSLAEQSGTPTSTTPEAALSSECQRAIVGLASDDPTVRALSAWKLGEIHEEAALAVPVLLPLLHEGWGGGTYITVSKDEATSELKIGTDGANVISTDEPLRASQVARDALVKIGKPAVDYLIEGLKDDDLYYRIYITEILGEIGDDRAFVPLLKMLDTRDGNLQIRAVQSIVKINHPDSSSTLMRALSDSSWTMRQGAAVALGELRSVEAVNALADLQDDSDSNVRKCAAEALAKIFESGGQERDRIISLLLTALQDEDWYVRRWTAASLRAVDTPSIENALIDMVSDDAEHMVVRETAATTLGYLASRNATSSLIAFMELPDYGGYEDARSCAAVALCKIALSLKQSDASDNKEVISNIVDAVIASLPKGDGSHRWKTIEALAPLKDPKTTLSLTRYITDEHNNCREICAFALGELGDPIAVPELIEALQDGYWVVQKNAAEALGKIRDKKAIEALENCVAQTSNKECETMAKKALLRIREAETVGS